MVGIARGGHCQTVIKRIVIGHAIVTFERGGGVEYFNPVNLQRLQNVLSDSGPEKVIRMGRNSDPTGLVDQIADFKRGPALEVRQYGANTEEVALGCRDLHA